MDINSCKDPFRSDRPLSVRTKERIKTVREKIRRNLQLSGNKMAAEENVSNRTMQITTNKDLGFRLYHRRNLQSLIAVQIIKGYIDARNC